MVQKPKKKWNSKTVISGMKLSLWPMWTWPMPKDATRFKTICMNLYQDLCIIMAICLEAPLIYAIMNHNNDFALFVELFLQQAAVVHAICNIIFHKVNYHHIQNVVFEMEHFCDSMKPHEEVVIQRYIDKYAPLYGTAVFLFYSTAAVICAAAPILQQPFPTLAEYPFDVNYQPLKTIIFTQQCIVAAIISGQLCLNVLVALLLWFTSARFEILINEFKDFTNVYQLTKSVKMHQEILLYIGEVTIVVRCYALTSICCSTVNVIICGVSLLTDIPLILRCKYIYMILACLIEIFMFTWPAEKLIFLSNNICQAVIDTPWYDHPIEVQKIIQIIIARSQKAVTIAIPCITPSMSFSYLTTYCSTIMSYFTTLRVMLNNDD